MQEYLFFTELKVSAESARSAIVRPGCGIEYSRADMEGIYDLETFDRIFHRYAPFCIEGTPERFGKFSDALKVAARFPSGARPGIYDKYGYPICTVDLT